MNHLGGFYSIKKIKACAFLVSLFLMTGCSYFKVAPASFQKENIYHWNTQRYVIVHDHQSAWHLDGIVYNEKEDQIQGTLRPVNSEHEFYKAVLENDYIYDAKKEKPYIETHIYASKVTIGKDALSSIQIQDIIRIEDYEKNKKRTTGSHIRNIALWSFVGLPTVLAIIVGPGGFDFNFQWGQ